jgi:hypothetical protein
MAQVGRISGPLLTANLERQGKNLDFRNASNSVPTLKLDVNTNKIGVNLSAPAFDLDVNSTINAPLVRLQSYQTGNLSISGQTIQALSGNLVFDDDVYTSRARTQQIDIHNNTISTYVTNANLNFLPNGTGTIELQSTTNVTGSLHATGDITIGGNLTIGDSNQDTITLNSDVDSDVIPVFDSAFDLGKDYLDSSQHKSWQNLHVNDLTTNILTVTQATIDNIDFTLRAGNIFYVSSLGSDTNKGDHPQSQFLTIRRALEAADSSASGPTIIHVAPGDYAEQLPLEIPANTSILGHELRNVTIFPDTNSQSEDVFLIDGDTTIENITIKDFYYDSVNDKGYAIRFKPNATVTNRSPYFRNITVLTKGSTTSATDPRGYNAGDAGRAILADGASVTANSEEASMLFHAFTAITPGAQAVTFTNGVRVEWLNSFIYFAETGIKLENGLTGHLSTDGSTVKYGAEMRCIGSANVYGNKGIIADGNDCVAYLIDHNFAYIGNNEEVDNDKTTVIQSNEVTELNNGKVLFSSIDHNGDLRVGSALYVNQETGEVDISSANFDFSGVDQLVVRTEGSSVTIDSTQVRTDFIRFQNNMMESVVGELNITSPQIVNINANTNITGNLGITGNITIGGELITFGDADTDSIDLSADLVSNIIPNFNNTYSLGSISKSWSRLFTDQLDLDEIQISGNNIITNNTNSDLLINPAGTGQTIFNNLEVGTDSTAGAVTLDGTQTFNNDLNVNASTTFTGDIISNKNTTFNTVTASSINAQGMANFEGIAILGNKITSTESDSNLEFRPNGTGQIIINTDVDATNIQAPTANYSFDSATMTSSSGERLITNNYDVENQIIGDIKIEGNRIDTISTNADLEFRANGTGTVILQENVNVTNDISTSSTDFTTATGQSVTTNYATVNTEFIAPGSSIGSIKLHGNTIETFDSNADLEFRASGTGTIQLQSNTTIQGNLLATSYNQNIANYTNATFDDITITNNVTAPTNIQTETVSFVGNAITTNASNSDLDLRASGTGIVKLQEDVLIENNLTINGATSFNISNAINTTVNDVTTNDLYAPTTAMFEQILVNGNSMQTYLSNSDFVFKASGTGNVVINDSATINNALTIDGILTVGGINLNDDIAVNQLEMSGNIFLDDNFITTTESNSNLELRANGAALVELQDLRFKDNVLDTKTADSTAADIIFQPGDYLQIDSTGDLLLPKGNLPLYQDAQIHYDINFDSFVGYSNNVHKTLGGLASDDQKTRVLANTSTNGLEFYVKNNKIADMGYPNSTTFNRVELAGIDIDGNLITSNITNSDLLLLPEQGTGAVTIDNWRFLDNNIQITGTDNHGEFAGTGDGYVKFDGANGVVIPTGGSGTREPNPEQGHIRYNTSLSFLEVFDGASWVTSAGSGAGTSEAEMQEIMNEYILIFG